MDIRDKISLFCDVEPRAVIPMLTMPSIYEGRSFSRKPARRLRVRPAEHLAHVQDLDDWRSGAAAEGPRTVEVAVVGGTSNCRTRTSRSRSRSSTQPSSTMRRNIHWVHSEDVDGARAEGLFAEMDGIVVPGGFGERGIGKLQARAARLNDPVPGALPGPARDDRRVRPRSLQHRRRQLDGPTETAYLPITLLDEQRRVVDKGGSMRRAILPAAAARAHAAYGTDEVSEAPPPLRVQQRVPR
jgi:CTP synthase